MTIYSAEHNGKPLAVHFELIIEGGISQFEHPSAITKRKYRGVKSNAWVFLGEKRLLVRDLEGITDIGFNEPVLAGSFEEESKTLSITNIQSGIILDGQHFMAKTIQCLLKHEPSIRILELDNINNERTKEVLQRYGIWDVADIDLKEISPIDRKPMMAALDECGFVQQHTFMNGACGIRATRP